MLVVVVAARAGQLLIKPGTYLLTRSASAQLPPLPERLGTLGLAEFVAPAPTLLRVQVQHVPAQQATAGQPVTITATVAGVAATDSILLVARHYYGPTRTLPMHYTGLGTVAATVPAALTYPGLLHYWVVVKHYGAHTFPTGPNASKSDNFTEGGQPGSPRDWDFVDQAHYEVPLVAATAPLPLFRAAADQGRIEAQGLRPQAWVDYPTTATGSLALRLVVAPLKAGQPAPAAGPAAALRVFLGQKMAGRPTDLPNFKELVIKGQTNQPAATQLRILLVTKDAVAYAATVPLAATLGEVRVPLSALQPAPLLLSPRPYPGFLPLTFSPATRPPFQLAEVEVLQLVLEGPAGLAEPLHVDIESVVVQ